MRVALISYHTSPFAHLGTSTAGGMNLYVRSLAEGLAMRGVRVDVFTRRDSLTAPEVEHVRECLRVFHLQAGPAAHVAKSDLADYTADFERALAGVLDGKR